MPQSKRYGFVEFRDHAHALACVRELSRSTDFLKYLPDLQKEMILANPQAGSSPTVAAGPAGLGKLLVEFCLENQRKVQVLKKRSENNETAKTQRSKEPTAPKQQPANKKSAQSVIEAATLSGKRKANEITADSNDDVESGDEGDSHKETVEPSESKKQKESRQQMKKASAKAKRKKIESKRKEVEKKRKETKKKIATKK